MSDDLLKRASSVLRYEPETGEFIWISPPKNHPDLYLKPAGSPVSSRKKTYWAIQIDGKKYKRGRLAILFSTGNLPDVVDHINGDSTDDRISNIRAATVIQNSWNHKTRAKKSSCVMGIRQLKNGKFQARISCNKKHISLGTFGSEADANSAYKAARKSYFGEFHGL